MRSACCICLSAVVLWGCGVGQTTETEPNENAPSQAEAPAAPSPDQAETAPSAAPPPAQAEAAPPPAAAPPPQRAASAPPPAVARSEPASPPKDLVKTKERLINVTAKCQAAEDAYNSIKMSTAKLGLSPNPEIATAFRRMQAAIEMARKELEEGQEADARESLTIAEASADKVLRAAGGG